MFGFKQAKADNCLFIYNSDRGFLILLVHVDDLLVSGSSEELITDLKNSLHEDFTIKYLGFAKYFLGLEIARSTTVIYVSQKNYISDIVVDTGLQLAKDAHTPLPKGLHLQNAQGELLDDPSQYRRSVGRLPYLGFTSPDIMHSIHLLSQFVQDPHKLHWAAALHVVHYLKHTSTAGLFFDASSSLEVIAFCDADWVACRDTRRVVTGYCVYLGSTPVSWKSKKQTTISRSSG